MFRSILEDFKGVFRSGNMLSKIIVVNIVVFVVISIILVFDPNSKSDPNSFGNIIVRKLSMLSDPIGLLKQIWSVITHMFLHEGLRHIFWNMLLLYWFGRIVGDLLGDQYVLPLYILGGLAGAAAYFIFYQIIGGDSQALGASAAVMCMLMVAATTSPDYEMNLLLLGRIRLKYIAIFLLFLDLLGVSGSVNTGGHAAHLGGAVFGWAYVILLRQGTDLASPLKKLIDRIANFNQPRIKKTPRSKFTVYKNEPGSDKSSNKKQFSQQEELDRILDKISKKGMDKLTAEEKEFLYQASKKK